jgi:hypothetical protein
MSDKEYQMKAKGKITEREIVISHIQEALSKTKTADEFLQELKGHGYEPYYRNGVLTGITVTRKYRFSGLGFPLDRMRAVDRGREDRRRDR